MVSFYYRLHLKRTSINIIDFIYIHIIPLLIVAVFSKNALEIKIIFYEFHFFIYFILHYIIAEMKYHSFLNIIVKNFHSKIFQSLK